MKQLLVTAAAIIATHVFAQEPIDPAVVQKIRTEALDHSQVPAIAHRITDVAGPRLTNSPAYNKACAMTVELLKEWGISNARTESWGKFGKGWENRRTYAAMSAPYYKPLIAYPVAWTSGTNGPVSGTMVLVNSLDSAGIMAAGDIRGKIVIVKSASRLTSPFKAFATRYADTALDHLPDAYMVTAQMLNYYLPFIKRRDAAKRLLAERGALALINTPSLNVDGTVEVDGTNAYDGRFAPYLTELSVSAEQSLPIQRMLAEGQPVTLELDVHNEWFDKDTDGHNVIAELQGTDKSLSAQVVMLGAHFDSWHAGTGATDNAAGSIVMLEAMRILKTLGLQPKRTIRLALWGGEEEGLYGSFGYVVKHFGNPQDMVLSPDQKNVSAYYNLDNGTGKIRGIYLQNNDAAGAVFRPWLDAFRDLGATGITRSNTGSTDHLSFDAVGIPGFQFIQDPMEYETRTHHTNMDTYDHLSIDDLKQAAAIVAAFVYQTSVRKEMIPRKPLPRPERFVFDLDYPF